MADTLSERVLARLREEMTRKGLKQSDLAGLLSTTQARISRLMNGETTLTVDDLEALAFAVGIQPTEAVRDRGLEFCAEMAPHELRVLEQFRKMPQDERDAIATLLRVKMKQHKPDRHAGLLPDRARPIKKS